MLTYVTWKHLASVIELAGTLRSLGSILSSVSASYRPEILAHSSSVGVTQEFYKLALSNSTVSDWQTIIDLPRGIQEAVPSRTHQLVNASYLRLVDDALNNINLLVRYKQSLAHQEAVWNFADEFVNASYLGLLTHWLDNEEVTDTTTLYEYNKLTQ